jgi:ribosomal protein S18 acetylase RimI-like enzyme
MNKRWNVRIAGSLDFGRWMLFVKTVQHDFHGIDLFNDDKYRSAVIDNIKKSTAIYIENELTDEIIGAMLYSTKSNRINWIAVSPSHRREGIGTSLIEYLLGKLPKNDRIEVKTFLETEAQGKASRGFYKSLGFMPKEIMNDINNENAGIPFQLFVKE